MIFFIFSFIYATTPNDIKFLLSFKKGDPEWDLFEVQKIKDMAAVKWKLLNIQQLMKNNPKKHEALIQSLEVVVDAR